MKKSLTALAVLVASGAAMAQSSVAIYGRVDLSVGSTKELDKSSQTKLMDGNLTGTRLGFRGTEDLGGGLKANFKIEHRFDADTGVAEDPMWKGESTVGLAGNFGEIKLGRSLTLYDDVRALSNKASALDSNFTPSGNGVFKSGGDYSGRFSNKFSYSLPEVGGFYAGVDYALDEDPATEANMLGGKIGYKVGPMEVAMGLQKEEGTDSDYVLVAGAYDFGALNLSGGYNQRKGNDASGDDTEYTLGVAVPMGAVIVSLGYAHSETKVGSATTSKASGFGIGASYTLSKRTKLYGGMRTNKTENGAGAKTVDDRLVAVGIRHDF